MEEEMLRRFSINFAIFSTLLDVSLTVLALFLAVTVRPSLPQFFPLLVQVDSYQIPLSIYVIVPIVWGGAFLFMSVYDPKRIYKIVDEFQNVTLAIGLATLVFSGVLYLAFREFSRWLLVNFVIFDFIFLLFWRVIVRSYFRVSHTSGHNRKVLIVGAGRVGERVSEMIQQYNWAGLNLVGFVDDDLEKRSKKLKIFGKVQDACRIAKREGVDDVIIALPQRAYSQLNNLVLKLHELPVNVRIVPDYFSLALYRASVEDFSGIPMINLRDPALNEVQRFVKRVFDLMIGIIVLFFVWPIIFVVAIIIKFDSQGSIIFRQQRLGENGRIFNMYKFRTMVKGAEQMQHEINRLNEDGKIVFKTPDDPRITNIGRFLRRTSLDELPQLFNVLKGDMSLVGPRPELPWMVNQYEIWQHKRFAVPQGMTGWWQVNGRSDKPMHLNTDDDIFYVQNYSIWMDLYILLKTPWVVLRGKGAY
jgi:exopolysaccharide biosynthesis polyprenyl glycosylphosphotransferase